MSAKVTFFQLRYLMHSSNECPFTHEMETHLFDPTERSEQGYAEEEQRKGPKDNGHEDGHDLQDLTRRYRSGA